MHCIKGAKIYKAEEIAAYCAGAAIVAVGVAASIPTTGGTTTPVLLGAGAGAGAGCLYSVGWNSLFERGEIAATRSR